MDYAYYENMTDEELENSLKELYNTLKNSSDRFYNEFTDIFKSLDSRLKDVEVKMYNRDIYRLVLGKFDKNGRVWDIDLDIDYWHREENGIHFKVNFGVSGSFGVSNTDTIEKYTCLGILCSNLENLESKVFSLESFKEYDNAHTDVYRASYVKNNREEKKKDDEKKAKRDYYFSRIKVGSIIDRKPEKTLGECVRWDNLKSSEIVWKTDKNIRFDNEIHRVNMNELLEHLVSGWWVLKDNEKTTDIKQGV